MKTLSSLYVVLLLALVSFPASAQSYPRGDVDQDGSVDIADVTLLISNILNGVATGDVNQDGEVDIADVTSLIDYLLTGAWPDEPVTHEWVDLGLPSGTLWATRNVGATAPEEYGDYFAWGETAPKDYYSWRTVKWYQDGYFDADNNWHKGGYTKYCTDSGRGYNGFTDGKTELDPEDDAAYVNWGSSWRMPTTEQQRELIDNCTWTWTTRNGVNGELVTGPNGNTIFLPAAGYRWSETLGNAGTLGYYWSRTLNPDYSAYSLDFLSGYVYWDDYGRGNGLTVRAVRVSQN